MRLAENERSVVWSVSRIIQEARALGNYPRSAA